MIFLSHSSADSPQLTPLVVSLRGSGVEVWFDGEQIRLADSVPKLMSGGIASSERMLVAWSTSAAQSVHVSNEIDAFYMLHPDPGAMLFLCLDATSVPALYAARLFLPSKDMAADASAVAGWAAGSPLPQQNGAHPLSPVQALQQFPYGPMVPQYWIPDSIIAAYALAAANEAKARILIDRAIRLRLDADPGNPNVRHVIHGELPLIGNVGPEDYWYHVFAVSSLYGPRMIAALLITQSDDLFGAKAKRDRAQLLLQLRLIDQQPGGDS